MSNLSEDINKLKKNYRKIFLDAYEKFNSKICEMNEDEFKKFLKDSAIKEVYEKQLKIVEHKQKYSCKCCGACCKLACSEFSPEELKEKSKNGDVIAKQFIETFVPYENKAEAQKIYPEYFELLKNEKQNENIYFYHCPKVTEDNKCSDYENRPQICRSFPDNPIEFLPKTCAYLKWKEECEEQALSLHAELEIIEFYKTKLQ